MISIFLNISRILAASAVETFLKGSESKPLAPVLEVHLMYVRVNYM